MAFSETLGKVGFGETEFRESWFGEKHLTNQNSAKLDSISCDPAKRVSCQYMYAKVGL